MPAKITTENLDTTIANQIREQLEKELSAKEFDGWQIKVGPDGRDPICRIEVCGPDGRLRTGGGDKWDDPAFRIGNKWDSEHVRKIVEEAAHIVKVASQEKAS